MRYLCLAILAGFLLVGLNVRAEEGKEIFDSLRCGSCHKIDTGKANPSLKEITRSYKGMENRLLSYLNGEVESIVNPEKGERMKRYIEKTKGLKAQERKTLADFILSHRD